jgi:glucuronate isomerase
MPFITEKFLLEGESAVRLYQNYAACQSIFDYHCHLSPREIAEDRRFENLTEIWLEGDHYKWRAMRANGIAERYCTGNAPPYEKFLAWARTVPATLRNPLYQWTHLELKRYFDIDQLLDETTAAKIWEQTEQQFQSGDLTAQGILQRFGVEVLCTTDDPADPLIYHERLASSECSTLVFPTFRPDQALRIEDPLEYKDWIEKLSAAANLEIGTLASLLEALRKRHDYFDRHGCRLSDHGLDYCYAEPCTEQEAATIFAKAFGGATPSASEREKFVSFLMLFFGHLDAEKGWTKQLHVGALRNVNTRMFASVGRDSGFDSIGDWPQAKPLLNYLDRLDRENILPKTIIYNLNPADDYVFAALIGNFQDGKIAGKVQLGSAWWFLDQKQGIEWQVDALSNCGLLSHFIGMTTDSRSFMSFPRHEYFRRVLCNLLGHEMENGQLPNDEKLIGGMVRNICFENAHRYFGFPVPAREAGKSEKVVRS